MASNIVFTHVPKTAGASIHHSVLVRFGVDNAIVVTGPDVVERVRSEPPENRRWIYVGGHIRFAEAAELFPSAFLVSSLRAPVERMLSHFFYVLRQDGAATLPEEESVLARFSAFYENLMRSRNDNLLCRYLSGQPSANAAIESVARNYTVVWNARQTRRAWPLVYAMCYRIANSGKPDVDLSSVPALSGEEHLHVAPVAQTQHELATGARPSSYLDFLPEPLLGRVLEENAQDVRLMDWLDREHEGFFVNR